MKTPRIALVTGANKGLGFETSRQLAQQGIKVLMGARSISRGRASARKLHDQGLDVAFMRLDVTKSYQIKQAAMYIKKTFGRLDILVNNAGMAHKDEPLFASSAEKVSPTVLRAVFNVNFFGLIEVTQLFLPLIRKSDYGRIVNVASILGSLTIQSGDSEMSEVKPFAYDSSKTAVNAFTVHLAAALKDTQIKVNSAHPGWVKTDMGGDQAPMSVEEGAKTAVMLATLGPDGPTGKFFHFDEELPW